MDFANVYGFNEAVIGRSRKFERYLSEIKDIRAASMRP